MDHGHRAQVFEKPVNLPFDAAFVHDSPIIWVARNSSKPWRPIAECWVFYAGGEWSYEHAGKDDATSL
jgi:hypothetical protein